MKRLVTSEELVEYYGVAEVTETADGFEVYDNASNLIFVLPKEFYLFRRNVLIDAKQFLTLVGSYDRGVQNLSMQEILGLDLRVTNFQYLYGIDFSRDNGEERFYLNYELRRDSGIKLLLLKMGWDLLQGVSNYDWFWQMQKEFGDDLLYSWRNASDETELAGEWYFVLKATGEDGLITHEGLGILAIDYVARVRRIVENAERLMTQRERRGCIMRA